MEESAKTVWGTKRTMNNKRQRRKSSDKSDTRSERSAARSDSSRPKKWSVVLCLIIVVLAVTTLGFRSYSVARSLEPKVTYTNTKIGIAFEVPSGWSPKVSTNFPDQVLDLQSDSQTVSSVIWVDRFPDKKAADYTYSTKPDDEASLLVYYSHGIDTQDPTKVVYKVIDQQQPENNGTTWRLTVFTMEYNGSFYYVKVYLTDMPNGRGAFALALMAPVDSSKATPPQGDLDDLEQVFSSLRFVR